MRTRFRARKGRAPLCALLFRKGGVMRQVRHVADSDDAGMRLDTMLYDRALYASRSAAARAIEAGEVLVEGAPVAKKYIVRLDDVITCEVEEEKGPRVVEGQDIDLDVRYEDEDMLVLSKQVGLVCHPSVDHFDGTLVNALIYRYGANGLCNVQGEDDRLGIVHRLDRDTSGLMLAAKTNEAGQILMDDIRARAIDRRYLALVHGIMAHDTGMIDAPIARDASERTRMAVRDCPSAREAITTFRVLERFEAAPKDNGYTLIECKLFTGRTHQIRVHMQYTRHPIVGDPMYNTHAPREESAQLGLLRQFLHSFRIGFDHPIGGNRLEFADNLPADLCSVLSQLQDRSMGVTEAGREVAALQAEAPFPSIEGIVYV